jgi:hypothetical protein
MPRSAAQYSSRPAYPNPAIATVTPLRSDPAEEIQRQAAEAAEDVVERLFTAALDLRTLLTKASTEVAAERLRVAIDQLDAAINGIFAAALDREHPPC